MGGCCRTRTRSINPASWASRPVSLTGSHVSQRPAWKLKSLGASPKFLPDSSPGTQSSGDKVGALVACVTPGGDSLQGRWADGTREPCPLLICRDPRSREATEPGSRWPGAEPSRRSPHRQWWPAPPECAHDPWSPACHLPPEGHRTHVALSVADKTSAPRWGSMSTGPGRGALAMAAHGKERGLARTPPGTSACTVGPWGRGPPYAACCPPEQRISAPGQGVAPKGSSRPAAA